MKEPILFVPGMMSDWRVFAPQVTHLSRNFPIHMATLGRAQSIREMAADILYTAPSRFALCGIDMGGCVAMEMLRRAPERITRVALISTTPLAETPEQAVWREPQIVKALAGQLEQAMAETFVPDTFAPGSARAKVLAEVQAMAHDLGAETYVRHARALQKRPDAQKALRMTRAPSMVLCGAHDKITPERRHTFMAEMIPYAELVTIDDAGHLPTLETPEKVNIALEAWMDLPLTLR